MKCDVIKKTQGVPYITAFTSFNTKKGFKNKDDKRFNCLWYGRTFQDFEAIKFSVSAFLKPVHCVSLNMVSF